jgi:hypothetical protein
MSDSQVAEIDSYIDGYKAFDDYMPPWKPIIGHGRDWQSRWPITDAEGVTSGMAHFECDASFSEVSIAVTYRRSPIYRLDLVPVDKKEGNPFSVRPYAPGLPETFFGSHIHAWADHREWVRVNGLGELPFRRPLSPAPSDVQRALEIVAQDLNLTVLPTYRGIVLPVQSGLQLGKGGKR